MHRMTFTARIVSFCLMLALAALPQQASCAADILKAIVSDRDMQLVASELRAAGPASLDQLFTLREELIASANAQKAVDAGSFLMQRVERLDQLIDQVGMQRYCSRSRLFWYTDLNQAKQAARSSGKPILSLRMLGKLNEEFSCANSRFFRTTLYANEDVSKLLREHFILHWQSVRPVPKVTIDFGDGRKLERTLTGNSVHYVLTADGDVVDALPGLYGPKAFLNQITQDLSLAQQVTALSHAERKQSLAGFHQRRLAELEESWGQDVLRAVVPHLASSAAPQPTSATKKSNEPPTAREAVGIALPKARIETPLVRGALPFVADPTTLADEQLWEAIAAQHSDDARS